VGACDGASSSPGPSPADAKGVTPKRERPKSEVTGLGSVVCVFCIQPERPDKRGLCGPSGVLQTCEWVILCRVPGDADRHLAKPQQAAADLDLPESRRTRLEGRPTRSERPRGSENRARGGAVSVPSGGWREVAAALGATEGQSHE